jgi:methylenetetrahydrofolate dehydrogenase (NADP+) / methenyltetrahydrofolate cyclohydrolase
MENINGNEIAQKILSQLALEVRRFAFAPVFVDVLIGEDTVAASYVKIKSKRAEEIGIKFELVQLASNTTTEEVVTRLKNLQRDPYLSGLIVQLPLPSQLDRKTILDAIDPRVDVDCLGDENNQKFYENKSSITPPTAGAVAEILDHLKLNLDSLNFLVIGQGELVGKPVTHLLKSRGYKVETADASTANLKELSLNADIIISAVGQPKLVSGEMIKSGAILIDCGTSESAGSIVGDVDTDSVSLKARYLAPVPGGVGPVTVAKLLSNIVEVAKDLE